MGVWQPGMDGSDLNALHRSHAQRHVVSAVSANQLHRRNRMCGGGGELLTHALTATLIPRARFFARVVGRGTTAKCACTTTPAWCTPPRRTRVRATPPT
jgi:hypothetical protein